MLKKAAVAAGVFAISALTAGTIAFAQTATPKTSPTTSVTASPTTAPSMQKTQPSGAPTTGRGN